MSVYILHFSEKYHHSRHYVGFTERDIETRFFEHIIYHKSPLIDAVIKAKIGITLARIFPAAGREFERQLKRRKNTAQICPICRAERNRKQLSLDLHHPGAVGERAGCNTPQGEYLPAIFGL